MGPSHILRPPSKGHVDVWLSSIQVVSSQRTQAGLDLLSTAEHRRWQRFVSAEAADTYLAGRRLVRTTLSRYADVAPRDWAFETGAYGKPFIARPTGLPLGFNLAHTRGLVACAIHATQAVGIDVERIAPEIDDIALARIALTAGERAALDGTPAATRIETFFRYWTLKEAFIKATGLGLSMPLQSFGFDLETDPPRLRLETSACGGADLWHFREYTPLLGCQMALAVRLAAGEAMTTTVRWVAPEPGAQLDRPGAAFAEPDALPPAGKC